MPELPEVETVVRGLAPDLEGRTLGAARAYWHKVISGEDESHFNRAIQGRRVRNLWRRGKYIVISLDGGYFLVVHLRMTGRLYISDNPQGDDAWVRFSVDLDNGKVLAFSDARKFGRVELTTSLDYLEEKLGPEPLDLEDDAYKSIFVKSERAIKVFLLDQSKLAGVGNIYADEALYESGIHPGRKVARLKVHERIVLGQNIKKVLARAINHEGATISWYRKPDGSQGESQKHFMVYGRGGQPCYTCGTEVSKVVMGQRGTHFCSRCQI